MFEKLLEDAKSARHYNNGMCKLYREQRSLCALLLNLAKFHETSDQFDWRLASSKRFKEI